MAAAPATLQGEMATHILKNVDIVESALRELAESVVGDADADAGGLAGGEEGVARALDALWADRAGGAEEADGAAADEDDDDDEPDGDERELGLAVAKRMRAFMRDADAGRASLGAAVAERDVAALARDEKEVEASEGALERELGSRALTERQKLKLAERASGKSLFTYAFMEGARSMAARLEKIVASGRGGEAWSSARDDCRYVARFLQCVPSERMAADPDGDDAMVLVLASNAALGRAAEVVRRAASDAATREVARANAVRVLGIKEAATIRAHGLDGLLLVVSDVMRAAKTRSLTSVLVAWVMGCVLLLSYLPPRDLERGRFVTLYLFWKALARFTDAEFFPSFPPTLVRRIFGAAASGDVGADAASGALPLRADIAGLSDLDTNFARLLVTILGVAFARAVVTGSAWRSGFHVTPASFRDWAATWLSGRIAAMTQLMDDDGDGVPSADGLTIGDGSVLATFWAAVKEEIE